MEELPQPSDELSVDGCPVVHLLDDPTDVEYVLNTLYDPTFVAQKTLPLAAIGAFIRLGRNLAEHDALPQNFETITPYLGIEFDVVTLLSENSIMSALPSAYYRVVEVNTLGDLYAGILKDDGTRASLSEEDRLRCIVGRQALLVKQFQPSYSLGWLRKWEFTDCTSPAICPNRREVKMNHSVKNYGIWALAELKHSSTTSIFCAACTLHAVESCVAGRQKLWEELPEIFDLPPWDQLKNVSPVAP
ncbi:BTB domain-containing protein [Mycena sanguinolenta]|uniref:BTB domain-containing protein n=1 Tax=Mycena sanguinolenta TaxID=230812 RepID=A0A8H6Z1B5_9AGAR|nr:BTB domain-containing protein [Mycena sanguinolenta]